MQKVDFFSPYWKSETSYATSLFLYDEGGNGDVAHMTESSPHPILSVQLSNTSKKSIWFLPVDHNLNITKEGSSDLESVCDYLFTVNDFEIIVFGEIKNRRKNWINEAIGQLKRTVEIFRFNHDLLKWNERHAYVSNRHWPIHKPSTITREEEFKDSYNVRLLIQNSIKV